ncbi:MAG: hypothetical protein CMK54_04030 [Proteobacteria bacterium]|nr:hypothetical protein [Pseudomonadota bacterium]
MGEHATAAKAIERIDRTMPLERNRCSGTMPIIQFQLGGVPGGRRFGRLAQILDQRVVIEIEGGDLTTVEFDLEPVEPQAVVLRVGVPRAGLGLSVSKDPALAGRRPDAVGLGNLLGDPHAGPLIEDG